MNTKMVALLIGEEPNDHPEHDVLDRRSETIRRAIRYGMSEDLYWQCLRFNIFNSNMPNEIENARAYVKVAKKQGIEHIILFGTRARLAFRSALGLHCKLYEPKKFKLSTEPSWPITFTAVHHPSPRNNGKDGARKRRMELEYPRCFAHIPYTPSHSVDANVQDAFSQAA